MSTIKNAAKLLGLVKVTSKGVREADVYGGKVHYGFWLTSRDEKDRFILGMGVKTMSPDVAADLEAAANEGKPVELIGFLKSENVSKDKGHPNFIQYFYAEEVAVASVESISL